MWHERQAVELFHLLFLRALGARIDKALFVLKGGCNLRFFHRSVRYSEVMDLDIRTMAPATLRSNVDQVITGQALRQSLLAQGLQIVDATSPKQTATTQRWKASLRDTDSGTCVPTKVAFSRRNLGEGVRLEAISPEIQHTCRIYPVLVQHYDAQAALRQKINALAQRKHTQARDVFDIQLLLDGGAGKTPFTPEMRAISATAVERALKMGYDEFAGQVMAFLDDEHQSYFRDRTTWKRTQESVIDALQTLSGTRVSVMGGEQAAGVLAQVKHDALEKGGTTWRPEDEAAFKQPILDQYARQSSALYATARLWDDGIIAPQDTRRMLAAGLSISAQAPIKPTRFGVFRM